MGFFAEFNTWLTTLLAGYIGTMTARVAAALEPAVLALGVFYVLVWGYLQLAGRIEEPFMTGIRRILTLALLLSVSLRLWLYGPVIVDTFFSAPSQLAAQVIGAFDSVSIVDQILFAGGDAANLLLQKGGILDGNFSYYLAGAAVYVVVGLTAVYTIFLLALSRIALSVLLALGPLFLALLLFDSTKRFFESWLAQLTNYAFITILTVLVAALMMQLVRVAAEQAVATGDGIEIAHAVRVCLAAALVFLVMRQVMPMAAGLASGLALSTFGTMSAAVAWGLGRSSRTVGQFGRGALLDKSSSRFDSLPRQAGQYLQRQFAAGFSRSARSLRPNRIRRVR
jgi:type IV secretion system protein VirB6